MLCCLAILLPVELQYFKYVYVDELVLCNVVHTLLLITWQFCRDDLLMAKCVCREKCFHHSHLLAPLF